MEPTEEQILKRLNERIELEGNPDGYFTKELYISGLIVARNLVKQSIAEAQKEK